MARWGLASPRVLRWQLVWVAGEADDVQLGELREEVMSPRHGHFRRNQIHLREDETEERGVGQGREGKMNEWE